MFDNAANKNRIFAGIVQQNQKDDVDVIESVCEERGTPVRLKVSFRKEIKNIPKSENPFAHRETEEIFENPNNCFEFNQLRVLRLDVSEAKGPVYARGLQPQLVSNIDEFCMQIDAHTIFKQDWDFLMQQQFGMTENEFAVLSTYPTNYKDLYKNSNHHWEMPHLCEAKINGKAIVRNSQAGAVANLRRPALAPLWAAGLSFSKCHAERNVPNDVHLTHIFTGEEFARGARLWTHGYDFYSITRPIIGVYYGSEKKSKGGWRSESKEQRTSSERIATLLKAPGSDQSDEAIAALGMYNLGTKRTLEQYYEFSGVNINKYTTKKQCVVKYVPYEINNAAINLDTIEGHVLNEAAADVSAWNSFFSLFVFLILILLFISYAIKLNKKNTPIPLWKKHLLNQRKKLGI